MLKEIHGEPGQPAFRFLFKLLPNPSRAYARCPARDVPAFKNHAVRHAQLGKIVGDRATDHAAADDRYVSSSRHSGGSSPKICAFGSRPFIVNRLQNFQNRIQATDMATIQLVVDFKYQGEAEETSPITWTTSSAPSSRIAATATAICDLRDSRKVIRLCSSGFTAGNASNAAPVSRKFTSIETTRRSTPRKKSPARFDPKTHKLATIAVTVNAL